MSHFLSKEHPILEKGLMDYPPFGLNSDGRQIRDVSGVTVRANIEHLEHTFETEHGEGSGPRGTKELCILLNARIKDPAYHVTPMFLKNAWNSYSYEFVCFMGEFCRTLTKNPTFQYQVGQHYFISPLIRILGRPFSVSKIYSMFPHFGKKFAQGSIQFEVGQVTKRSAVLRMSFTNHVNEQFGIWRKSCAELICQSSQAGLASVPQQIHGLGPAHVITRSCISAGDDCCEWQLTWAPSLETQRPFLRIGVGLLLSSLLLAFLPVPDMDFSNLSMIIIVLLTTSLVILLPYLFNLHRSDSRQKQLVQDQLLTVDAQHEALREAYLQQEHSMVALKQTNAQLKSLHQTGLLLCSNFDREQLIDQVLHIAVRDLHYDRALISFFDQERATVSGVRLYGVSEDIASFARSITFPVTDPHSLEGKVLLQQQALLIPDIREEWGNLHPLNRRLVDLTQACSLIVVPLRVNDRVFGSLTVDRTKGPRLTQDDLDLIQTLGNQMAMAMDNALAYQHIEDSNVNLEGQIQERTEALEQANAKLQEQDRLKSSFVSIASHELRTPMTSIKGYVQNMLEGLTGAISDRQRQYLLRIFHNSERLTRLINQLLDLSQIETGKITIQSTSLVLSDLIHEANEGLQSLADSKSITLSLATTLPNILIQGDRDKIHQVFTNLIHNALRFTPSDGTVTIDYSLEFDGLVAITVSDTGSGIPDHEISKVFLPFFRGSVPHQSQVGAGLGLAISKTLIELHGGTVWVESRLGAGSQFTFTLPLSPIS